MLTLKHQTRKKNNRKWSTRQKISTHQPISGCFVYEQPTKLCHGTLYHSNEQRLSEILSIIITLRYLIYSWVIRLFSYHFTNSNPTNRGQTKLASPTNTHQVVFNCYSIQLLLSHPCIHKHSLKMAQGVCSLRSTETQCFISGCGGTNTCAKKHVTPCYPHTTRGSA